MNQILEVDGTGLFTDTVVRHSLTQNMEIWDQLAEGVRYLDIRLTAVPGEGLVVYRNGMIGENAHKIFKTVSSYSLPRSI